VARKSVGVPPACSPANATVGVKGDKVTDGDRTAGLEAGDATNTAHPHAPAPKVPPPIQRPQPVTKAPEHPHLIPLRGLSVRRDGHVRGHTIGGTISLRERRAAVAYPDDVERPKTRSDCINGERPCPFVSCRYHLYLDIVRGSLKLNFPDKEVDELEETCALDVADRGGETLERSGHFINVTRERLRQIEDQAVQKLMRNDLLRRAA
jgi:hypothetical protein